MPAHKFALVVRIGLNEAEVVNTGTKKAMKAAGEALDQKEFDFIGITRDPAEDTVGELVETLRYVDAATETERTPAEEARIVEDLGGQDVVDAIVAKNADDAPVEDTPKKESTAVVITEVLKDDKIRLTPHGAKFSPIVRYIGVQDIDGVKCLVGHDVEYDKVRTTPVDSLAKVEVKSRRYVEIDAALLDAIVLPPHVTPAPEVTTTEEEAPAK